MPPGVPKDPRDNEELWMMRWAIAGMFGLGLLAALGVALGMAFSTFEVSPFGQ